MNNTVTTLLIFNFILGGLAILLGVLYGRAGDRIDLLQRRDRNQRATIKRLRGERNDLRGQLRTEGVWLHQAEQRLADAEAVALTRPATRTPMPGDIRKVIQTAESFLNPGGER